MIINIKQKKVRKLLLNFPTISFGLVSRLEAFKPLLVRIISEPKVIKTEKKEKNIKFKIILKFPLVISL